MWELRPFDLMDYFHTQRQNEDQTIICFTIESIFKDQSGQDITAPLPATTFETYNAQTSIVWTLLVRPIITPPLF